MGHPRTTPAVLAALQAAPKGQDISADYLATMTGLEIHQVRASMRTLVLSKKHHIDVILRGAAWRYRGVKDVPSVSAPQDKPKEDQLFERIGKLASGEVLVRGDQTETIYVVAELALEG